MSSKETTLIAVGGGDIASATAVLDAIFKAVERRDEAKLVIMTVATSQVDGAYEKYNAIFRKKNIKHIEMVDVSAREDAFNDKFIQKLEDADIIFFTGGDQLNITSLFGGSPMHELMQRRIKEGVVIAGTSAGAAMMSGNMILGGRSDSAPKAEGVQIGPGLDLIPDVIIDTHFSQRGRHGRLLTAIAHYPQIIGIGLDEKCAIVAKGRTLEVVGEGCVTVFEGASVTHCDLAYRKQGDCIGILGVNLHVLPSGYSYDLEKQQPIASPLKRSAS